MYDQIYISSNKEAPSFEKSCIPNCIALVAQQQSITTEAQDRQNEPAALTPQFEEFRWVTDLWDRFESHFSFPIWSTVIYETVPFNSLIVLRQGDSTNYNTRRIHIVILVVWVVWKLLGVTSSVSLFSQRHSPDKQRKNSSRRVMSQLAGHLKVKAASFESGSLWTVSVISNSSSFSSFLR